MTRTSQLTPKQLVRSSDVKVTANSIQTSEAGDIPGAVNLESSAVVAGVVPHVLIHVWTQ